MIVEQKAKEPWLTVRLVMAVGRTTPGASPDPDNLMRVVNKKTPVILMMTSALVKEEPQKLMTSQRMMKSLVLVKTVRQYMDLIAITTDQTEIVAHTPLTDIMLPAHLTELGIIILRVLNTSDSTIIQ